MKALLLTFIAALVLSATATSNVLDLTPENFDSVVDGSKHVMVEFFAPWCGHCKNLAPVWEELGDAYAKDKSSVVIAKVDADAHRDLGSRFGVTGFPTLKFFKQGEDVKSPKAYNSGRDLDSLVNYITDETGVRGKVVKAATKVVTLDPNNFDQIVNQPGKTVFVEFYAPWCGHCKHLAPDWEKLGFAFQNEPNVVIAKIDADAHKSVASKYDVSGYPTLKFFTGKGDAESYEGSRDLAELVNAVNAKANTKRTAEGLFQSEVGRTEALDELAEYFMTKPDERASYIAKTEAAAKDVPHGEWYVKYMKAIQSKGADFVAQEEARLKGYVNDKKVAAEKIDGFSIRLNVLNAFKKA